MRSRKIPRAFGAVLRRQRRARGLSQEKLGLNSDVDRTFISEMERGIHQPSITTLFKLASVLKVQPSSLVTRVERILRRAAIQVRAER